MKVKIVNKSKNELPFYSTVGSAGMDLKANIENDIIINPLDRVMIPTGNYIQLPKNYEAQIRPRSGLAIKHGITVINTPGTIDCDYIGEICVLLINLSKESFTIKHGDRIAQMIITNHEKVEWETVDFLDNTQRGTGGFGHTGL